MQSFRFTASCELAQEFRTNIKYVDKSIHLTRDDYDALTENGKHLCPSTQVFIVISVDQFFSRNDRLICVISRVFVQEFNREQFKNMMKRELWRYSRRELSNVIEITGDDQFRSTIVM